MARKTKSAQTAQTAQAVEAIETVEAAQIDPRTPGKDLRLIQCAVRRRWAIKDRALTALPDAMLKLATDKKRDDRARVNAAKVLVSMHAQNDPPPRPEPPPQPPQQTVNVGFGVGIVAGQAVSQRVEELLHEPDYLRYLESRESDNSGPVRENGESGALPDPATRNGHLNGHNGHHSGSNGTHAAH